MKFTEKDFRKMIDLSLLHNVDTEEDVKKFAEIAKEYDVASAITLPSNTALLKDLMKDCPSVMTGCAIAFPTGAETIEIKEAMTDYFVCLDVEELDYVVNIGWIKDGKYDELADEVSRIVKAGKGRPVKAIIEVTCLTDDEIAKATLAVAKGGATFVKTGTGTMSNPTTVEHIKIMAANAPEGLKLKAAGGIRTVETLLEMVRLGVTRFGIGAGSAIKLVDEFKKLYPDGVEL